MKKLLVKILDTFWETKSPEETKKFFGLSIAGFFLLGASWPLRIAKDSLLVTELGAGYQPFIKALAIVVCLPLTLLYSTLVCFISGETVLYIVAAGYAIVGLVLAAAIQYWSFLGLKSIGILVNIFYVYSESFSAVSIAPFWAFVNDITKPQEAQRKYSMIVFFAQFGGLVFALISREISRHFCLQVGQKTFLYRFAVPVIILLAVILMMLFALTLYRTIASLKKKGLEGYVPRNENQWAFKDREKSITERFSSGLGIIMTSGYVFGIFLLTSFQEIISTVMHYNVLKSAQNTFSINALQSAFIEDYLIFMQIISVIFSMKISSWIVQKYGIRNSLTTYPILLVILLPLSFYSKYAWVTALIVALEKGFHYAINRPIREILYIPTTHNIKYQAKGWIDIFGSRTAKLTGSGLNKCLELIGTAFAPIIVFIPILWIVVAGRVGQKYQDCITKGVEIKER